MEKDNYLKNAEVSAEQNYNMIDGIPNNTPSPPVSEQGQEPPRKKRSREREDR